MAPTNVCFAIMSTFWVALVVLANGYDDFGTNSSEVIGHKPNVTKEEYLLSTMIGVQGIIYCKSDNMNAPIEGAVTRVTCDTVDKYGYEASPITILSEASNANGYFLATLSPYEVQQDLKVKECKALLDTSPLETCPTPTDVNNGFTGVVLSPHKCRYLKHKNMKLFTVGPFFYTF